MNQEEPKRTSYISSQCISKPSDIQERIELSDKRILDRASIKIDIMLILPLLIAAALNGMDRASLGLSKVVGLEDDLGMSGSDFNLVASIMYPSYILFMLPSNIALRKVGARIWLGAITISWGLVNMCMAFVRNRTDLILCRLFLGATESGFNSGVSMMISLWYPRSKMTARMGLFYSSSAVSIIIGGPVASGLTKITNKRFKPWGWLFFIEGLFTAMYGLLLLLLLSDYPDKSWILSKKEKDIINCQLTKEQAGGGKQKINKKRIIYQLRDPLIHIQSMTNFANNFGLSTVGIFGPIVVNKMGFSSGASQAIQSVPGVCGLIGVSISRYYPKWFRSHCLASLFNASSILIGAVILLSTVSNGARIFGLCLIGFGAYGNVCIDPGWAMNNSGGSNRSAVLGATTCGYGGLGSLCASYIYRNKDEPRYLFGHGMNIFGALLNAAFAIASYYIIVKRNRRKKQSPLDITNMTQNEVDELENDHPSFRYVI